MHNEVLVYFRNYKFTFFLIVLNFLLIKVFELKKCFEYTYTNVTKKKLFDINLSTFKFCYKYYKYVVLYVRFITWHFLKYDF